MAAYASAVQVFCQLSNSAIAAPTVGGSASGAFTYTDGDTSLDSNVNVGTGATALNADIVGNGFLFVSNPAFIAGVANTVSVSILCAAQAMGPLPPGGSVVLPLASGTVYNATVAADTLAVGVTVIECDPNA